MAKKLNKKVALLGSVFLVIGLVAAIIAILYLFPRDPYKLLEDAELALTAAREAEDPEIRERQFESAERNFHRARSYADSDHMRVEVLYRLTELYNETDQWQYLLGSWREITRLAPDEVIPRLGLINYFYNISDTGGRAWNEVIEQVDDFLEITQGTELLEKPLKTWDVYYMVEDDYIAESLEAYLYLAKGRALFERARAGVVTDRSETLEQANEILEKVIELEPANSWGYLYLAESMLTRGNIFASAGQLDQQTQARHQAQQILADGTEEADDKAHAEINRINTELQLAQEGVLDIEALEPEFIELAENYPDDARALSALANYYLYRGHEYLPKALQSAEKAMQIEPDEVSYAILASQLYHMKGSLNQNRDDIAKAIEIAENALLLPGAQEVEGPRQHRNHTNAVNLYVGLARCYTDTLLDMAPEDETRKQQLVEDAENTIHQIAQLLGTREHPEVVKWDGILNLARGQKDEAIRQLYAAHNQLEAAGTPDSAVAYRLAMQYQDTGEIGAVREFLTAALQGSRPIQLYRPDALLDYARVLIELRQPDPAFNIISSYEQRFEPTQRSTKMKLEALIRSGQYEQAEEQLTQSDLAKGDKIHLELLLTVNKMRQIQQAISAQQLQQDIESVQAEPTDALPIAEEPEQDISAPQQQLRQEQETFVELAIKLLEIEPELLDESSFASVSEYLIETGQFDKARQMASSFVEQNPNASTALLYGYILDEPDPAQIDAQRRQTLQEKALGDIEYPIIRKINLGIFYRNTDQSEKAKEIFQEILQREKETQITEAYIDAEQTEDVINSRLFAAEQLFEMALQEEDYDLAEQVVQIAIDQNLDRAEGSFFQARLLAVQENYSDALQAIDRSLEHRPVFSRAYLLRSNIYAANENYSDAVDAISTANSLNPLDAEIATRMAVITYQRNQTLGTSVSSRQQTEADNAFRRAIALSTGQAQMEMLSMYAEFIRDEEPLNALAIRQNLLRSNPTIQNAVLLGELATELAKSESDEKQKESLFDIAQSAFERAMEIDPSDRVTLHHYAEHLRERGKEQQADQVLAESEDPSLLWRHYYNSGRFDLAKEVLESMHTHNPEDPEPLQALMLVSSQTRDTETVSQYGEKLLQADDSIETRLLHIKTLLDVGLIQEAETALADFNEQYDDPRASLLGAWLAQRQGRLEEALRLVNDHISEDEENAESWRLRGEINLLRADYDQAIIDLNRSKSLADRPATRIALARAYHRAGRSQNAISELTTAVERPDTPMEAGILLAEIYQQLGRTQALRDFYSEMIEKYPQNIQWYKRAGDFAFSEGDYQEAAELFRQGWQASSQMESPEPDALDGYLKSLLELEKFDELFTQAGRYTDSQHASIAYMRMAEARLETNDRETAIRDFRSALQQLSADETAASWVLQRMYELLGSAEVEETCRQILAENPDSFAANWTMFNLAKINEQYNRALEYLEKSRETETSRGIDKMQYTMNKTEVLQSAYAKTSDNSYLERAIKQYDEILTEHPDNSVLLNNLAYLLAKHGKNLDQALEYAEKAYQIMPNAPHVLDTYAYALYKNGRLDEAENFAQAALQQYESSEAGVPAEVWHNFARIKAAVGQRELAREAYQQALSNPDATEQMKKQIEREIDNL